MNNEADIYYGIIKEIKVDFVSKKQVNDRKNKTENLGSLVKMEIDGDIKEFVTDFILSQSYVGAESYVLVIDNNNIHMVIDEGNIHEINLFSLYDRVINIVNHYYMLFMLSVLYFVLRIDDKWDFLFISFILLGVFIKSRTTKKNYFKIKNMNVKELFILKKSMSSVSKRKL